MAAGPRLGIGWRKGAKTVVIVGLWVFVWQLVSWSVGNSLLLAGPLETVRALCSLVGQGAFWSVVVASLVRIVGGFLLSFVLGLVLAALSTRWPLLRDLLQPLMSFIKSTPVVCIVVLLLVWFGSREVSMVAVLLVVLPAIYFSALEALAHLDGDIDGMLRLNEVPAARRVLAFVWPSMQPFLLATSELVVGMSWKAGVAAELIGAPLGSIGERIYQAKILLETADLFAWTFVVIALAFVCERAFLAVLAASAAWTRRWSVAGRSQGAPVGGGEPGGLALRGVTVAFDGRAVLDDVDWDLAAGGRVCLLDPSGAGKTTMLETFARIVRPDAGTVEAPARLSMAFQEPRLLERMSALDNVRLVAGRELDAAGIGLLLGEVLPAEAIPRPVAELSGGQRRRVELVRALARSSQAVLLDEPFSSLDHASHEQAAAFVVRHLDGRTLLVATHDEADARLLGAEAERPLSGA